MSQDIFESSYERAIEDAFQNRSSRILDNYSIDHARVVIDSLLKLAIEDKLDVCIVAGSLDSQCYNDFTPLLDKIAQNGNSVRAIVVEKLIDELSENKFAQKLILHDKFELVVLSNYHGSHFLVVGNSGFRFEESHPQAKALLSFNQPDIAKKLVDLFNDLFASAKL